MAEKIKSQTEGKEVAEVSDEELQALMNTNAKLQEKENEGDGVKADYILLAKDGCKALKKKETELYIEGLEEGDIYIQKDKINLGKKLKVVPLAFVTLYNEYEGTGRDAKFVGRWNKEQAVEFPLVEGNNFNRQLPNKHILVPVNWVMVEILGHKEIENAVIAFKSTGSRIWRKWKEDAKNRSSSSATLIYTIKEAEYENADYEWTDFGFDFAGSLLEEDKNMAVYCLKKSNAIREAYEKNALIGNHNTASLAQKPVQAYIEDASDVEDSTDDEANGF